MLARSSRVRNEHKAALHKQMTLSKALSSLSPLAAFTYLATDLANTGIRSEQHFRRTVDTFRSQFVTYINGELASRRFLDRPDVSDMPEFRYETRTASDIAGDNLIHILLLVLFNAIFLMAAFLSFLRYDVR